MEKSTPLRVEWQPHLETVRRHLEEAEQQIRQRQYVSALPLHSPEDEDSEETYEEKKPLWAQEMLESSLRVDPSGRAYADLGESAYCDQDYEEAIKQYTHALEITPDAAVARQGLLRSREAQKIQVQLEAQVKRLLPSGQHLQYLFPFPVPGRTLWTVLSCEEHKERPTGDYFERGNALITVCESEPDGRALRRLWRSDVIPPASGRNYVELYLEAFPMTGNKIPELVFMGVCSGGSANPSLLHIYRWNGKGFRNVLQTESGECAQWITDLHHTGHYEVRSINLIGSDLCHGDMIRWAQIYAWNGVRFAQANAQYPEAFHKTRNEIQEQLKEHAQDGDLWQYLGLTYLYDHKPHQARSAFEKATEAFHSDSDYGSLGLAELAEIRGDRQEATYLYRQIAQHDRAMAAKETDTEIQQGYREEAQRVLERAQHPHLGENFPD
jgi:tetratricopeptide (TPR) repeat protein